MFGSFMNLCFLIVVLLNQLKYVTSATQRLALMTDMNENLNDTKIEMWIVLTELKKDSALMKRKRSRRRKNE
jgi:hypothetical protein